MGNNNVTGQQVSEETANRVNKNIETSNGSPDNTNSETNNEKDGTEDVDLSKSSKDLIITTSSEDKQTASYQNISSHNIEDLDDKNMGSIQGSTQEDDQSSILPKDDEPLTKDATETTGFSTDIIALVSPMIEDVTSNKNSSLSSEKIKQIMHGTRDTSGENIESSYKSLLQENIEGSLEDKEETSSHENATMGGNLAGEENLEHGYIEDPTVEVAILGEITSSTESIASTYLDADDSEIKEVVIEDKPGQRDSSPDVKPLDGINIETSKNDNIQTQIQHDREEMTAISKTATVKLMIDSVEAVEDDKHIHGLGNQDEDSAECTSCDNLYDGEVVAKCQSSLRNTTTINDQELGNYQNERVVASRQISGFITPKVKHTGVETIYSEEGIVEKTATVWNLEDNFAAEKEPKEYDGDLVSIVEVNGKDFTGLHSSSLDRHLIVNEVKVQREVNGVNGIVEFDKEAVKEILEGDDKVNTAEGLGHHVDAHVAAEEEGDSSSNFLTTTPSTPPQLLENIEKEVYINRDAREAMISSQGDQSQQILLEEYKVVKLDNGEILSKCMQLVRNSSNVGIISTDGINDEKVSMNTRDSVFNFEANQKEVTTSTAATGLEYNQAEVTASVDMASEEQRHLQTSTPVTDVDEETPLLQAVQNIDFFSSAKQHSQVDVEIPMTDIALMQTRAEVEEESEKSPLLSPRETSGGDFRIRNHFARNKKPFQSLLTECEIGMRSPMREPEPKSNSTASSPRSKEKQKPRSSLFTSCMCCATATN
ncbi:unnamed protein product [Urochloa humidicola]